MTDLTKEFLGYALEQAHSKLLEWFGADLVRQQLEADVKRDTEEFFSDAFAARYASSCAPLNLPTEFFKHRVLEVAGRRLIAGIRFLGMDLTRPFVEIARISQPIGSDAERDKVSTLLRTEFNAFAPTRWRMFQSSSQPYQFAACDGDKRLLARRLSDITALPMPVNAHRVALSTAHDLEFYDGYSNLYFEMYRLRPWLRDVARVESLEDMQTYLETGRVFEVFVDGEWAGVTVATRETKFELRGWYMIEIALHPRFAGQGLGVALQCHLAGSLEDAGGDCLFGTIGAVNAPMLKTAARVGRVDLGGKFWVRL